MVEVPFGESSRLGNGHNRLWRRILRRGRRGVRGFVVDVRHINEEHMPTPIDRVAEPVGAVFESADAARRLGALAQIRDGAVATLVGDSGSESDPLGVRRPAPGSDAELLVGHLQCFSAVGGHDVELSWSVPR